MFTLALIEWNYRVSRYQREINSRSKLGVLERTLLYPVMYKSTIFDLRAWQQQDLSALTRKYQKI